MCLVRAAQRPCHPSGHRGIVMSRGGYCTPLSARTYMAGGGGGGLALGFFVGSNFNVSLFRMQ